MRTKIVVSIIYLCFLSIFFALPVSANNNADTNNSTLSVSPSTIPADGSTTATISITVKDGSGNALSGDHVTLTSTTDSGLVINSEAMGSTSSTAATDSNGNVTFTVKSSNPSPGTDTFTAADTSDSPSVPLGSNTSVTVTLTASALAPSSSCSNGAPGTPQLTSAVANGNNQITLTWTDAADPVTYYLVSYGIASGQYIYGNPNVGGQGTTSYTVNNLAKGTTYYFVVKAVNGCAPGSASNEVSATTTGGIITTTPTPALSSDTNTQTEATPTDTPTPTENVQPTASPTPVQTSMADTSKTKTLEYIIICVLIIGGIGVFISWKYQKKANKINKPSEETDTESFFNK